MSGCHFGANRGDNWARELFLVLIHGHLSFDCFFLRLNAHILGPVLHPRVLRKRHNVWIPCWKKDEAVTEVIMEKKWRTRYSHFYVIFRKIISDKRNMLFSRPPLRVFYPWGVHYSGKYSNTAKWCMLHGFFIAKIFLVKPSKMRSKEGFLYFSG